MQAIPIHVKALEPYIIRVLFSDGTEGETDLSHLVTKPVLLYGKIKTFSQRFILMKKQMQLHGTVK